MYVLIHTPPKGNRSVSWQSQEIDKGHVRDLETSFPRISSVPMIRTFQSWSHSLRECSDHTHTLVEDFTAFVEANCFNPVY